MKRKKSRQPDFNRLLTGTFGLLFLISSLVILLVDRASFSSANQIFPPGSSIGGVPVAGLDSAAAQDRLQQVFSLPVELQYRNARLQLNPAELGFQIDSAASLAQLGAQTAGLGWWPHLWGKAAGSGADVPLVYTLDENVLRTVLAQTFEPRYDQPPTAVIPIIGSTNVMPGQPGWQLASLDEATAQVKQALISPNARVVVLRVSELAALPIDPQNLEIQLKQTIQLAGFDGLAEVFLQDLSDGTRIHFAQLHNQSVPVDVAYSAASTIKIPIMVSALRRLQEPLPPTATGWMTQMLTESLNPPADALMKNYLDFERGPLMVTADLTELGYVNTFLGGYFEPGSPLLQQFSTPANTRRDVFIDPDVYNQTVPSEIGDLLARIYACADGSAATGLFEGQVTPSECQLVLDLLKQNKIGSLIEAGLPSNVSVAHKHGWTSELDGLLHTLSDAGIVFSPDRDYVLVIFLHSSQQLIFDTQNRLFAKLSQSIYNAYNPGQQAIWLAN